MNPKPPVPGDPGATLTSHSSPSGDGPPSTPTAFGATDITVVPTGVTLPPAAASAETKTEVSNFGKYELLEEIARGGMGVVYKARQHGLDRLVALKMILAGSHESSGQRFLVEAKAAAALDHPNVVPVYDSGEVNGSPYFTMALVEGPNLRNYVADRGVLPVPEAVLLFGQIVAGVAHAHRHGIVHRDLKPANVLMDKDGRPRVTDFGLAKRAAGDANLTATGQVVGTPAYMAPEQARDSKDVGPPADVYALGAIFYFLLTGRAPFDGDGVTDLLIKVVTEQPKLPSSLNPEVPEDVEAPCLRCLSKLTADRPTDAPALLHELGPISEQYVPQAYRLTPSAIRIPGPRSPVGDATKTGLIGATVPMSATDVHPFRGRPWIKYLVAAVVVLVGATAFIATRGNRTTPLPPPAEPVAQVTPPGPDATPPPAVPVAEAWPTPTRNDFKLNVQLIAPAAKKDANGAIKLMSGSPMEVHLLAERDCRVTVWVIDPAGNLMRVLPNSFDSDDRLVAGKERVIPPKDGYAMNAEPTEGVGFERLWISATTGESPKFPPGIQKDKFTFYTSPQDKQTVASTVRGISIKKAGAVGSEQVSEAELLFRVQP